MNIKGELFNLKYPSVMGILNVTEYSFFDGGKYFTEDKILARARQIVEEGADMVDIGAMATNPSAPTITEEEEAQKLSEAIAIVKENFPHTIISVDTYHSQVAKMAVEQGAHIINDISGGMFDENMFSTIAALSVPYILMHTSGLPSEMQQKTQYKNVVEDVIYFLSEKINRLHLLGVSDIIVDPGFGFGKTVDQNFELLKNLHKFSIFHLPILAGLSRKSMFYKLLQTTPEDVLPATLAGNLLALQQGTHILRVHDVKETRQMIEVFKKIS